MSGQTSIPHITLRLRGVEPQGLDAAACYGIIACCKGLVWAI